MIRALGVAIASAIGVVVGVAGLARAAPEGFDHLLHEGKVVASGAEVPGCDSCHKGTPPRHPACFSSGCHTMKKGKICVACHESEAPPRRSKAHYPPYRLERDFATRLAHDRHAARGTCEPCHGVPAGAPGASSHARCDSCHRETPPLMDQCASCHAAIAGRDTTPSTERGAYSVAPTFSHDKHLERAAKAGAGGGDRCAPCHANVATTPGDVIPVPTQRSCETCHDGKQAFSALGSACRVCHATSDDRALPSDAPRVMFSHEAHASRGLAATCDACHTLDAAGTPRPASRDHLPCATEACHANEFRTPHPKICGACHVGTEPWRPLRADVPRRARTEFGVEFSHAAHLDGSPPRIDEDCASCHVGIAGGPERRLGRGHASCAGSACHAPSGGAPPSLDQCASCHRAGLLPARDARRAGEKWSVAARFRHATHTAPCATCHATVAASRTVDVIETPRKPTCAPCHDGGIAFKMTGHGCARCHGK